MLQNNHIHNLMLLMLGATTLILQACTGLPTQTQSSGSDSWRILRQDAALDVRVRRGVPAETLKSPRLGKVILRTNVSDTDHDALDTLRSDLEATLNQGLVRASANQAKMNVRILDAKPVSPAANVISTLLLFVPLDQGSVLIETENWSRQRANNWPSGASSFMVNTLISAQDSHDGAGFAMRSKNGLTGASRRQPGWKRMRRRTHRVAGDPAGSRQLAATSAASCR